ncbi:hypothetical protein T06_11434 [Trichinella sp. T6]|nr:hypothetical protein T06_11434 [Trichinella sp. T6]
MLNSTKIEDCQQLYDGKTIALNLKLCISLKCPTLSLVQSSIPPVIMLMFTCLTCIRKRSLIEFHLEQFRLPASEQHKKGIMENNEERTLPIQGNCIFCSYLEEWRRRRYEAVLLTECLSGYPWFLIQEFRARGTLKGRSSVAV